MTQTEVLDEVRVSHLYEKLTLSFEALGDAMRRGGTGGGEGEHEGVQ